MRPRKKKYQIDDFSDCDVSEDSGKTEQPTTPNQSVLQSRVKWMSSSIKSVVRFNLIRNALAAHKAENKQPKLDKEQAVEANEEPRMEITHESRNEPDTNDSSGHDPAPDDGRRTRNKEVCVYIMSIQICTQTTDENSKYETLTQKSEQSGNTIENAVHDGEKESINELKAPENPLKVRPCRFLE